MPGTPTGSRGSTSLTLIEQVTVGAGGQATIDFLSISGAYDELRLVTLLRGEAAADNIEPRIRFNNDSGANYAWIAHFDYTAPADATLGAEGETSARIGICPAANMNAASYAASVIQLPFYLGDKWKSALVQNGSGNADGLNDSYQWTGEVVWKAVAEISRITLITSSGDWAEGSIARLLGLSY